MLDRKRIIAEPEETKRRLARRNKDYSKEVDRLIELDAKRRSAIARTEKLKAEQNAASKKIPVMKKEGKDTTELLASMKALADKLPEMDGEIKRIDEEIQSILLYLPNQPNDEIPDGLDSEHNKEVRRWSEPRSFSFTPKPHWEIGENLKILDAASAAKVTGARFHFYRGLGARLERAVFSFFLDTHTSRGYTEILPPYLANTASVTGTGQLPKFGEDMMFKIENTDYYLIPTAEVPVTNLHRDEILTELPIHYCAYSACFRAEAGSAGRDTRGLIRQHQFNKVELVKFCRPEKSYEELEKLTLDAEFVLQRLGLPYRTVTLCTGDLGNCSAKTYDIEVWMPSYGKYIEISSCSNFEDYQARRASIRYRENSNEKPKLVHTLNGSGVAVGRTVAAILETFQNEDGTVAVPEVLRQYMGGIEFIK